MERRRSSFQNVIRTFSRIPGLLVSNDINEEAKHHSHAQDESGMSLSTEIQDYDIEYPIGVFEEISHGFMATHRSTGRKVSLKMTEMSMSVDFNLIAEIVESERTVRLCQHPNILRHYVSFLQGEKLWSVMEPVEIGSIRQLMDESFSNGIKNVAIIATIMKEVIQAVSYIHSQDIIHNNLRADNILLNKKGEVKITGFHQTISRIYAGARQKSVFKFLGYPEWMAPEVLSQATTFNQKADIYSLGILALELMNGKTPFDGWPALKILLCKFQFEIPDSELYGNDSEFINNSNSHSHQSSPSDDKETSGSSKAGGILNFWANRRAFSRFVTKCLHRNPEMRPTAQQLLSDPFIRYARSRRYIVSNLINTLPEDDISGVD